ncbi:MAG TPA: NAD-dependent deacylase, partial [Calditrichaeota bacterium]|nr:NAD-dependent deacylase [Calditrichota bacterium]
VVVLTGAGISAESGVPTFRGKDGLWNDRDVKELATPQALENETEEFWKFYNWRRKMLKDIKPNLGHYALVDMERTFGEFDLITQNVDNLHIEAGNKRILELHGNITRNYCTKCGKKEQIILNKVKTDEVPLCASCGGVMRPDIVLFGEALDRNVLSKAQEIAAQCEIFFSVGTSSLVEPAASLPYVAKANGSYLVEINKEKTPLSDAVNETILGNTAKILPYMAMILERIR